MVRPVTKEKTSEKKTAKKAKKAGVKVLKMEIEDEVYARLRDQLGLKIAMGNFNGLQDEVTKIIISTIEKGDDFVQISMRKGGEA